ncbi:MAG: hypothetical protein RIS54_208 [Verrucomicrobiota bacterium]
MAAAPAYGNLSNLRLTTSASWTENISRSFAAIDWADAMTYYQVGVTTDFRRQLASSLTGTAELGADVLHRPEFNRNDEINFGVKGELKQKFGLGPFAPALTTTGSVTGKP